MGSSVGRVTSCLRTELPVSSAVRGWQESLHHHHQLVRHGAVQGGPRQAVPTLRQALPRRPCSAGPGGWLRAGQGRRRFLPCKSRSFYHEIEYAMGGIVFICLFWFLSSCSCDETPADVSLKPLSAPSGVQAAFRGRRQQPGRQNPGGPLLRARGETQMWETSTQLRVDG